MKNTLSLFGMKPLTQLFVLLLCFVAFPSHAIETITYYHTDSLGSPVAGTDANGALLWKEDYKPYGERIRKQVESEKNNRWYTGHPEDKETGLTYAGARFYDSVTGRFLAIDPVGFNGSIHMFNRYAYANNNPYKYVDPNGESAAIAACLGGPVGCAIGLGITILAIDHGIRGTQKAFNGAKDEPTTVTDKDSTEWVYGPEDDPKINGDGSTKPNTWTTPDDFKDQEEAQDKLDPFKPLGGRRRANIPKGTSIKKGNTPGGEGPYNGSGGGNETLIPKGLPPGSVGPWKRF